MRFLMVIAGTASLCALATAAPSWGQAPAQTTASAPAGQGRTSSAQTDFEKASALLAQDKCAEALPLFAGLHPKAGSLPFGVIAVRRGTCLIKTGDTDAGLFAIRAGLPILEAAGQPFAAEVAYTEYVLGRTAAERWQHDTAIRHFRSALTGMSGAERLKPLMELARIMAFDGGSEALALVDEGLGIESAFAEPNSQVLAAIRTMRGRILMNQGRNEEARKELEAALKLSGGLTLKASLSQVIMRGDLAQAALLNGDEEDARRYLAYTGAGRIEESSFTTATNMEPPACGSETGLRPEDQAVVIFGIGDNGDVTGAETVYSRGNYEVAAAFARAVSQWHWAPESLAKIPPFYRASMRIEVRCSTRGGNVPSIVSPLNARFVEWASAQLPTVARIESKPAAEMERLARMAAALEKADKPAAAVAALGLGAIIDPRPGAATLERMDRALALAKQEHLPLSVVNYLRIYREQAKDDTTTADKTKASFALLAADPEIAADPLAQATLLLLSVPQSRWAGKSQKTRKSLATVADNTALGDHHPLRQNALVRLADLAVGDGDFALAHAFFERTGLTEQQCALIGVKPAVRSLRGGGSYYPDEALRRGFEGWVRVEYDIGANGRTEHSRPIVAYPPFVFVDAADRMVKDVRYEASYRPSGGDACSANQNTVRFTKRP